MQGLLFGLCVAILAVIGGMLATFRAPGAMFDALLAPISSERRRRHVQHKMDRYYQGLTKELLQSQFRTDLLADDRQDSFVTELRRASKEQNALRRIFDEFAFSHDQAGRKVWTEKQFTTFVSSRLGDGGAARALWRCFCYNAAYPFTDTSCQPEQQQLDMDGWTQAIALLATDAVRNVGRNRAQLSLYGASPVGESRKSCAWRRFISFAVSSGDDVVIGKDDWHPPNVSHEVASVAATQLPLDMSIKGPPLSDIQQKVQRLVDEPSIAQRSARNFIIPYQDMLNLLCAIMQVSRADASGEFIDDQSRPSLSSDVDRSYQIAVAQGNLETGGICSGSTVSFPDYIAFSEKFHAPSQWPAWSFDRELTKLWFGLFFGQGSNIPASPSSHRHPPTLVLQAVDFLYPFQQSFLDRQKRQQSTLLYSTDSGLSRDGVLKALSWPFSSKIVVVYGTTTDVASQARSRQTRSSKQNTGDSQPAILVIMTSSPLWSIYETGEVDDFLVGDAHLLLELAPRPRILWHAAEQTKYADLVDTADDALLSFGNSATHTADGSARCSGLTLNVNAGVATLCSLPSQAKGREQGYVEIPVGPRDGPSKKVDEPEAWETAVRIQKIEVYSGLGGVPENLTVRRASRI